MSNESAVQSMENIKKNHKSYLEQVMKTNMTGAFTKGKVSDEKIKSLMIQFEQYSSKFSASIDPLLEGVSMSNQIKAGVLSGAAGVVSGLVARSALKEMLPIPDFTIGKNLVINTISVALGGVVANALYNILPEGTRPAKDSEAFQQQLKESGFFALSNDLTEKFIRLFHYRESLLFGKQHNMPIDMRADFKDSSSTDEYKIAVETYFLTELDKLFVNTFKDIYEIHDEEIQNDKNSSAIVKFIKDYFGDVDPNNFTQKLQVNFLIQVNRFLVKQMDEATVYAQYPYLAASALGLAAGALALAVAPAGVALVSGALMGIFAYYLPSNIESLMFTHSKDERQALKNITQAINDQAVKLDMQTKQVTPTSNSSISQLQNYVTKQRDGLVFYAYILVGSTQSWLQEYAKRYRHSKRIETDLGAKAIEPITQTADRQTIYYTKLLAADINNQEFKTCIEATKTYLNNRDNSSFIEKFGVKAKVKDQVLEIIATLPKDKVLPQYLTDFYVNELGGIAHDLMQIRELKISGALTDAAKNINKAFGDVTADKQAFILKGDTTLRHLLALPADEELPEIDEKNIDNYLTQSRNFLFSLLKKPDIHLNAENHLEQALTYSNEFSVYHTLLLKQLAKTIDPNNQSVDGATKAKIHLFLKEKLFVDYSDLLSQAFTDSLLIGNNPTLESMSESMRNAMAYTKRVYSPYALITAEAGAFMNNDRLLFALHNKQVNFMPEASKAYMDKLDKAIESTARFIEKIKDNPILIGTGAYGVYLYEAQQEITNTIDSIQQYINDNPGHNQVELSEAIKKLDKYKQEIDHKLSLQNMHYDNPQYYQLIDEMITKVQAYEKSQYGTITRFMNDTNKIKVATAVFENLKALKNKPIEQVKFDDIFKLSEATEQNSKDLQDLKSKVGGSLLDGIRSLLEHFKAYIDDLASFSKNNQAERKQVTIEGSVEIFYEAKDHDAFSEDDVYEECNSEIGESWELVSMFNQSLSDKDHNLENRK
ncbi:hypothetical protein [Cysteiniphilum sp. QT6929]|uniref:hypothetical protein n=1 Tax=Cysteiniphilum sp. QT6929 TaxID=2975055 RepID=UPI0024B3851D|nr:hypothetical protein [Cysteiniphilum sp. QT6929]WHN64821.1 hypothetical protein NYP54_07130 [Cysteiniphilum sp. QT6929]